MYQAHLVSTVALESVISLSIYAFENTFRKKKKKKSGTVCTHWHNVVALTCFTELENVVGVHLCMYVCVYIFNTSPTPEFIFILLYLFVILLFNKETSGFIHKKFTYLPNSRIYIK